MPKHAGLYCILGGENKICPPPKSYNHSNRSTSTVTFLTPALEKEQGGQLNNHLIFIKLHKWSYRKELQLLVDKQRLKPMTWWS